MPKKGDNVENRPHWRGSGFTKKRKNMLRILWWKVFLMHYVLLWVLWALRWHLQSQILYPTKVCDFQQLKIINRIEKFSLMSSFVSCPRSSCAMCSQNSNEKITSMQAISVLGFGDWGIAWGLIYCYLYLPDCTIPAAGLKLRKQYTIHFLCTFFTYRLQQRNWPIIFSWHS